jgi:hypothetical protein
MTNMRSSHYNLHGIPHAAGVSIMACDDRSHVHFVLFDKRDPKKPAMQFTLTPDELTTFVARARDFFDGTILQKDPP